MKLVFLSPSFRSTLCCIAFSFISLEGKETVKGNDEMMRNSNKTVAEEFLSLLCLILGKEKKNECLNGMKNDVNLFLEALQLVFVAYDKNKPVVDNR